MILLSFIPKGSTVTAPLGNAMGTYVAACAAVFASNAAPTRTVAPIKKLRMIASHCWMSRHYKLRHVSVNSHRMRAVRSANVLRILEFVRGVFIAFALEISSTGSLLSFVVEPFPPTARDARRTLLPRTDPAP